MMHRFSVRSIGFLLLVVLHVGVLPFRAEGTAREFDIPSGRAREKLKVAASQGNVEVLISTDVSRYVRTRTVRGRMTAQEALDRMLEGTPFEAVPVNGGKAFGILYKSPRPLDREAGASAPSPNSHLTKTSPMEPHLPRKGAKLPTLLKSIFVFAFANV